MESKRAKSMGGGISWGVKSDHRVKLHGPWPGCRLMPAWNGKVGAGCAGCGGWLDGTPCTSCVIYRMQRDVSFIQRFRACGWCNEYYFIHCLRKAKNQILPARAKTHVHNQHAHMRMGHGHGFRFSGEDRTSTSTSTSTSAAVYLAVTQTTNVTVAWHLTK